jgi:hypothetical protein
MLQRLERHKVRQEQDDRTFVVYFLFLTISFSFSLLLSVSFFLSLVRVKRHSGQAGEWEDLFVELGKRMELRSSDLATVSSKTKTQRQKCCDERTYLQHLHSG